MKQKVDVIGSVLRTSYCCKSDRWEKKYAELDEKWYLIISRLSIN